MPGPDCVPLDGVILNGLQAVKDLARVGTTLEQYYAARPMPTHAVSFTRLKPGFRMTPILGADDASCLE
jgi:hypothetical protein